MVYLERDKKMETGIYLYTRISCVSCTFDYPIYFFVGGNTPVALNKLAREHAAIHIIVYIFDLRTGLPPAVTIHAYILINYYYLTVDARLCTVSQLV